MRYVIGDIHGAYKALSQVLDCNFDNDNDLLISLGDVADGWPEVVECFDRLMEIKNLIYIMGNHDYWLREYLQTGEKPHIWTSQGGLATIQSYEKNPDKKKPHLKFLQSAKPYHVLDNMLFVHGGFNPYEDISMQNPYDLAWDRILVEMAIYGYDMDISYKEVFVGHTTTSYIAPGLKPVHKDKIWMLDQGCGWEGKLTLMNIDTKEYFQSDIVKNLYPNHKGR